MKIIRPIAVAGGVLASTNAVEPAPAWQAAQSYPMEARVQRSGRVYESQVAANQNHDPAADDGTRWLNVAPANPVAMFDAFNQTQTVADGAIAVELAPPGIVDALALLNLDAASVEVVMTDAIAGEVYRRSFDLVSPANVGSDFYAWCFEPIVRRTDLHVEGLPAFTDPRVAVTIALPGGVAKCGNLVIGRQRELGATAYGFGFGIIDRSRKDEDDFGNITIVERPFRATGSFEVIVRRNMVDEVGRLLRQHRAQPIVYVGTGSFASAIYYGFFRDFRLVVENHAEAKLSIEIEGIS